MIKKIKHRQKVLVTGATGFLGRNIAQYLSQFDKYDVHGVWHKRQPFESNKIKWVRGDLTLKSDVERVVDEYDILIQMASVTSGSKDVVNSPYIHISDNAIMNSLILRSVFDRKIKNFVFPSCSIMYESKEEAHDENSFDLTGEIEKHYFGGAWNKIYFEKMCEFYSNLGVTKFTVIRHSNVYGPYDKFDLEKSHVFGASITKVLKNKDGVFNLWGDGKEGRDLIHVDDLNKLIKILIEKQKKPYELVCAGSGYTIPIIDLVKKIISISGKNLKIKKDLSKPSIKTNISLNPSMAKKVYNWYPEIDLDKGIKNTIEWYLNNFKNLIS